MSRIMAVLIVCYLDLLATGQVQTIEYYRLRLRFSTNSDWSTVQWSEPNIILACRLITGPGRLYQDHISLSQPLGQARDGHTIDLTADYAIRPAAISGPIGLTITKGDIGASRLEVLQVDGDKEVALAEFVHRGTIPQTKGLNPRRFILDLSRLTASRPISGQIRRPSERLLWAFYYPWYRSGDWSSNTLKDRPQIQYSSDDPCAISRHIDQAKAAGIDGFVSSWWGPDSYTDKNLDLILSVAQAKAFYVSIYLETLTNRGPRDPAQIQQWLEYLLRTYGQRPAYYKLDGRPLVVVWASGSIRLEVWDRVISSIREKGLDCAFVGMGYDLANLELFDGIHEYAIFQIQDLASTYKTISGLTRNYQLLSGDPRPRLWIATVQPGYDDRLIPGRAGAFQDRLGGQFYLNTFDAAMSSDPDWIFITTWNEWWEHTYIEPSELYGRQYLELTAGSANRWRQGRP